MIQYSPHLSIGISKDMFNILTGVFSDFHKFDAILDCSSSKVSKKWHKDKNVSLKNVYLKQGVVTKQNIKAMTEFISSMHKEHKNVLICSQNGVSVASLALFSYLVFNKDRTIEESIDIIDSIFMDKMNTRFNPPVSFLETVSKLV